MKKDDVTKRLEIILQPLFKKNPILEKQKKQVISQIADACLNNFTNFDDKFLDNPQFQKILKVAFATNALDAKQLQKLAEEKLIPLLKARGAKPAAIDRFVKELPKLVMQAKKNAKNPDAKTNNNDSLKLKLDSSSIEDPLTKMLVDLFGLDPRFTGQHARYVPYVAYNYNAIIDQSVHIGLDAITQLGKAAPGTPAPEGDVATPFEPIKTASLEAQEDRPQGIVSSIPNPGKIPRLTPKDSSKGG